jgi:hypothetical protein
MSTTEFVNLLKLIRKPTSQVGILATIFESKRGKWLKKRDIEKEYSFRWALRKYEYNELHFRNIEELIENADEIPGDIQRNLRLFYTNFKKYGLEQREKVKGNGKEEGTPLMYRWNPIPKSESDNIIHPAARNIFKTQNLIDKFIKSKKNTCEICGKNSNDEDVVRMAVDHWRSHSKYNIDDPRIAVLLCEHCNNIHHNHDACKIALKYKENTSIIKKWIEKEKGIREEGFYPNETDLKQQNEVYTQINDYHKSINPLGKEFWQHLFK